MRLAVAAIATMVTLSSAAASPACMTEREARAQYGDRWLYWHTEHRCWDDHRRNDRNWPHAPRVRQHGDPPPQHLREADLDPPPPDHLGAADRHPPPPPPSIWPDPKPASSFAYRWPDASVVRSPLQWFRELVEFNK